MDSDFEDDYEDDDGAILRLETEGLNEVDDDDDDDDDYSDEEDEETDESDEYDRGALGRRLSVTRMDTASSSSKERGDACVSSRKRPVTPGSPDLEFVDREESDEEEQNADSDAAQDISEENFYLYYDYLDSILQDPDEVTAEMLLTLVDLQDELGVTEDDHERALEVVGCSLDDFQSIVDSVCAKEEDGQPKEGKRKRRKKRQRRRR